MNCSKLTAAVGLGLALWTASGCGGGGGGAVDSSFASPGSSVVQSLSRQRFGMVYLTTEAPGAVVSVFPLNSQIPVANFTANAAGIFQIPEGTQLPIPCRLVAQAPEGVTVERYLEEGDQSYLFINGISSLISLYKRRHPQLSLSAIEAKLRIGLSIGNGGLYGTNDRPGTSFSHRVFLARAAQEGGLPSFLEKLESGIEGGQTFAFRPASFAEVFSPIYETLGWLLGKAADDIVGEGTFRATGKVNAAAGFNLGDAASFQQINTELDGISTQIGNFQGWITTQLSLSQFFALEQTLNDRLEDINTALAAISTLATSQATFYNSGGTPGVPAAPQSSLQAAVNGLTFLTTSNAQQTFHSAFTASATSRQNLFFASNAAFSSSVLGHTGDQNWANYDLREDKITQQIQGQYGSYFGYLTRLADLLSEQGNSGRLGLGLNTDPVQTPADALVTALDNIRDLAADSQTGQSLIPLTCGSDLVLIDSKNKKMWYLPSSKGKYNDAQNGMIGLEVNNWKLPAGVSPPQPVGSGVTKDLRDFSRGDYLPGWRLPTTDELLTLGGQVREAGGVPGGSSSDGTVLNGLKKLGFTGIADDSDHNYKKYWFDGSVTQADHDEDTAKFSYVDIAAGQISSESSHIADPRFDPEYSYIYVRKLYYSQQEYFGDTDEQMIGAYGIGPETMELQPVTMLVDPDTDQQNFVALGQTQGSTYKLEVTNKVSWSLVPSPPYTSDIAFLDFVYNGDQPVTRVVFRGPGSVTLQATVPFGSYSNVVASRTLTSTLNPKLVSLSVTPNNAFFSSVPASGSYQRFFATGRLSTGETVDLTNLVTWTVDRPEMGAITSSGSGGATLGGVFTFASGAPAHTTVQVTAQYTNGKDANTIWKDGGKNFSSTVKFAVN